MRIIWNLIIRQRFLKKLKSPDKYNQVPDNKDDVESQVLDNKSHISWGLLQHMYYLILFG